ncbi:TRAP transporter small permease [Pusillimonas sp.]|uniref:TRAP transporter small permease n=1 Tax=Pusillimonas sp. TaxID=3040095 RepID=UPI0037C5F217
MRAIVKIYDSVLDFLGLFAGFLMFAIACLIAFDLIRRNLFHHSLSWVLEVTEYLFYVSVMAAVPWAMREGAHVKMDAFIRLLSERHAVVVSKLVDLLGFATCVIISIGGIADALASYRAGNIVFKSVVFPEWWVLSVAPVIMALLAVEFARHFVSGQPPQNIASASIGES